MTEEKPVATEEYIKLYDALHHTIASNLYRTIYSEFLKIPGLTVSLDIPFEKLGSFEKDIYLSAAALVFSFLVDEKALYTDSINKHILKTMCEELL